MSYPDLPFHKLTTLVRSVHFVEPRGRDVHPDQVFAHPDRGLGVSGASLLSPQECAHQALTRESAGADHL